MILNYIDVKFSNHIASSEMLSIEMTNDDEISTMKCPQSPSREKITSFMLGNKYYFFRRSNGRSLGASYKEKSFMWKNNSE